MGRFLTSTFHCLLFGHLAVQCSPMQRLQSLGSSVSPEEVDPFPLQNLPRHLISEITEYLNAKEMAKLRTVAAPFRDLNLRADEWVSRKRTPNPFDRYRICIQDSENVRYFFAGSITKCWEYMDVHFRSQYPLAPILVNVKIQTLYDLALNRLPGLAFKNQVSLITHLLQSSTEWSSDQRRSVLFHLMQHGLRSGEEDQFTLPFLTWNHFCSSSLHSSVPDNSLIPVDVCWQAAALLTEVSHLRREDILTQLGISAQAQEVDLAWYNYINMCLKARLHLELMDFPGFLESSTNPNLRGDHGLSGLMIAAKRNELDLCRVLLDRGVDVNLRDVKLGNSALLHAVRSNIYYAAQYLMDNGANIDMQNDEGSTALMLAVNQNNPDIVALLLNTGAHKDICDKDGTSPLQRALSTNRREIVELLHKIDVTK